MNIFREKPLYFVQNYKVLIVLLIMVLLLPISSLFGNSNQYLHETAKILNLTGMVILVLPHLNIITLNMGSLEVENILKENTDLKKEVEKLKASLKTSIQPTETEE